MRTSMLLTLFALCAAVAAGCGDGEAEVAASQPAASQQPAVDLAQRHAELERDPYALRCGDIRDKVASARITRVVQYALADDAKLPGMSRLRASQSIFYAITELCRDRPDSFEPARTAIASVRSGKYRADLGTP
jgi:hypothetical protein